MQFPKGSTTAFPAANQPGWNVITRHRGKNTKWQESAKLTDSSTHGTDRAQNQIEYE